MVTGWGNAAGPSPRARRDVGGRVSTHGSGASGGGRQGSQHHLVPGDPRPDRGPLRPVESGRLLRAAHTSPASGGLLRGAHSRVQREHPHQARTRAAGRRRPARGALRPRHRSREPDRGGRGRGRVMAEPRRGSAVCLRGRPDDRGRAGARRRRARGPPGPAPRPGRVHPDRARGAAPGNPGVHVAPAAPGPEAAPSERRGGDRGGRRPPSTGSPFPPAGRPWGRSGTGFPSAGTTSFRPWRSTCPRSPSTGTT